MLSFKKEITKFLFSKKEYNSKHPVEANSFGKTYGEHRELEFNLNQHKKIISYCKKKKKLNILVLFNSNQQK